MNCSNCGFQLPSNHAGCRHYGTSVAHQEYECLAILRHELSCARETSTRLNRRVGQLEAALADAKKIPRIDPEPGGVRWVRGSLGRALLASTVEKQDKRIAELEALVRENVHATEDAAEGAA